MCGVSLEKMKTQEMEMHIESHFTKSPKNIAAIAGADTDILEKEAQKLREQREFEMLRAQYGMDDQGNFREQSAAAMQRAVYAGEMSVADYYERQVGLRAAESHGIDDATSCTKTVAPRVMSLSASSPGIIKSMVCSSVDHYASSYGDKGWGCGYRNLQMMLSSLLQVCVFYFFYILKKTQGFCRTQHTMKFCTLPGGIMVLGRRCQVFQDYRKWWKLLGQLGSMFRWVALSFSKKRILRKKK